MRVTFQRNRVNIKRGADEIGPAISECATGFTRKPACHCYKNGHASGGTQKVLHRQSEHLREVAHHRLAGIILPVGVRDEADGGVESERPRNIWHLLRVQWQLCLKQLKCEY